MKPLKAISTRPKGVLLASAVGLLIIALYTVLVAFPFLQGPSLTLRPLQLVNGITTLGGQTYRVSFLSINGLPIALSEDGSFMVERTYPAGYTAVTVLATDRFGRTLTKELTFISSTYGTEKEE